MPRKQRIEYPGARYHVISRGNYRKELFVEEGTGESFERTLFETAERCGWKLYAYVIMSNHYHLAVETSEPNLVAGMRWLQSTFATRFNRFRGENGHVFSGRYKSIVLSEDRPLLGLINYVHLNPVRAGICGIENLRSYHLSSYPRYWQRKTYGFLDRATMLDLCGLPDNLAGMHTYAHRLNLTNESDPEKSRELSKRYCRGWFLGSKEAKQALSDDLVEAMPATDWEGVDLKDLNETRWKSLVVSELERLGRSEKEVRSEPKGADWKVEIARKLRRETTASNPWIARRLNMGHPNYVSNLIHRSRSL
jgi:putative transposase